MKTILLDILFIIIYLFIGIFTWGLSCIILRLEGRSANEVYHNNEYKHACILIWFIVLPFIFIYLVVKFIYSIWKLSKKLMIAIVESIVAINKRDNN